MGTPIPPRNITVQQEGSTHDFLRPAIGFAGVGSFIPPRRVNNAELAQRVDTSDQWIVQHTGIHERRYAAQDVSTSDLAVEAARIALRCANMSLEEIGMIILATSSPNWIHPATACAVQEQLGIAHIPAFDVTAACSGFLYALSIGENILQSAPGYGAILVIGAETNSRFLNFEDRTTCFYLGDGAGAVILREVPQSYGILSTHLRAEGHLHDLVKVPAGGSQLVASLETIQQQQHYMRMDGRQVWQFVMQVVPEMIEVALAKASLTLAEIDHFIFHQANRVMIEACMQKLGISTERAHFTVERYGNTAAASIPITLCEVLDKGCIQRGDHVLCVSIGGGMTAASAVIRWY
jgi:3-oxoacyl-[acyl-carrier-protein] synthase III